MKFRGKELKTMGDVMDLAKSFFDAKDQQGAAEFMAAFKEQSPHAEENIGYMCGYYDQKTSLEMQMFFNVSHPVFGRRAVTADEAFQLGKEMGEKAKQGK